MGFDVASDAYDSFMGRYSVLLAPKLAELAGVRAGQTALDVGCGPGALTAELVRRLGPSAVSAVDPSESFVAAARARLPGVDVQKGKAEALPFESGKFDLAMAQLAVHFMSDPIQGIREMARVTRQGGAVAACVWDLAGGRAPISVFWSAAHAFDPGLKDESGLPGVRDGQLAEFFRAAGLREVESSELAVAVSYDTFDAWWQPFTLGVGPAGDYARTVDGERLRAIRERCRTELGSGPFEIRAVAWAARATSPG